MYYVYVLESINEGQLYIGSTNDLRRRLTEHNQGKSFSTKRYGQWKLVYYEAYLFETLARMREKRLKSHGNAVRELKKRILPSTTFVDKSGAASRFTQHHSNGAGFTLMELLVVMVLLGILVALGLTSFRGSQGKSRDSRRKSELRQIALALETYVNDKGKYPNDDGAGRIMGCAPDDASLCDWNTEFKDKNNTIYMVTLPADPGGLSYYYDVLGATNGSYQLYTRLENTLDSDVTKDANGNPQAYSGLTCGAKLCNYGIASTNTTAGEGRTKVSE